MAVAKPQAIATLLDSITPTVHKHISFLEIRHFQDVHNKKQNEQKGG